MNQEIVDYIQQAQKHGLTDFEIKQNLLNAGWEAAAVEENMVHAKAADYEAVTPVVKQSPPPQEQPAMFVEQKGFMSFPQNPGTTLSDQHFNTVNTTKTSIFKKPLLWVIITVLILAGGGAYAYFTMFASPAPEKVLGNFVLAKKPQTTKADYTFTYTGDAAQPGASTSIPTTLSLSGTLKMDTTDVDNIKMANNFSIGIDGGAMAYKVKLNYLLLGQVIYFDISQIDALKSLTGNENLSWIKLDLNELKDYASKNNPGLNDQVPDFSKNSDLKNKLMQIWAKADLIKTTDFLAKEKVNNTPVYHIKAQFDGQAFNTAVLASITAMQNAQSTSTQAMTDQGKTVLTAFLNKFKTKEFDLWIGQKDSQLYKINLVTNAPTFADFSNPELANMFGPLSAAQEKSREAKRLADVRQVATALELYYSDFGGYPEGVLGTPKGIIGPMPVAPTPADGTCTDYFNGYWYKSIGKSQTINGTKVYQDYTLSFCLGADTGGYKAGIAALTPNGIKNIPCTASPEQCVSSGEKPDETKAIVDAINKMKFSAQISFQATYLEQGQPQNITAPAESRDILDLIKNAFGNTLGSLNPSVDSHATQNGTQLQTPDEQSISNIHQLATALELYFNDKNQYPLKLEDLTPTYIGAIPIPTGTIGGACDQKDSAYYYKLINPNSYQLDFCLSQTAGSFTAGKHQLSQFGIK